jgi:hypothetical protein
MIPFFTVCVFFVCSQLIAAASFVIMFYHLPVRAQVKSPDEKVCFGAPLVAGPPSNRH